MLVQSIALAAYFNEVAMVHQAIEKGRNCRRVAEEFRPMCVTKGALNVK